MERFCTFDNNWAIQKAHLVVPPLILTRLNFDYFIGCDPIFAGLFNYEITEDGRSYRDVACVAYPFHQNLPKNRQKTTIVIPKKIHWIYLLHEIGHVLDEWLGFNFVAEPITEYAKNNQGEAFAEAFTAWLIPRYAKKNLGTELGIDPRALSLFESLT
jgi:hypothetical protein